MVGPAGLVGYHRTYVPQVPSGLYHQRAPPMAKPNYSFEKRQRELEKKRKKQEKEDRKTALKQPAPPAPQPPQEDK